MGQNAPGDTGQLVGERDRQHVAMQPLLGGFDPRLEPVQRSQLFGRIRTTQAACTNRTRRSRLPRFDILPRMVRSPVEICFGTRPSQAAKSRPFEKASPVPIAATMALEMIGPMPGRNAHQPLAAGVLVRKGCDLAG